jgi:steroid delta-isomerase-like uncharacterized protein
MTDFATDEEHESVIRRWAEAWNTRDKDTLLDLYTDDCVYDDVPLHLVSRGKDGLAGFADFTWNTSEGFTIELKSCVVGGDRGAAEWIMSGTLRQQMPGPLRVGEPYAVRGASIITFKGGKIQQHADFWDTATAADPIES